MSSRTWDAALRVGTFGVLSVVVGCGAPSSGAAQSSTARPAPPATAEAGIRPPVGGPVAFAEVDRLEAGSAAESLTWSKSGDRLALGTGAGELLLWTPESASTTRLKAHSSRVDAVAISSDGRQLVSADDGGEVALWEIPSGRCVEREDFHHDVIAALVLADGGELVTVDLADTLARRDLSHLGRPVVARVETLDAISAALSPRLGRLATGGHGRVELSTLDGGRVATISMPDCAEHPDDLACVTFRMAEIEELGVPELGVEPSTYRERTPSWDVQSLAFSSSGRLLVAGRSDGVALVIDAASGRVTHRLEGAGEALLSIAIDGDEQVVAAGGRDGGLTIWTLPGSDPAQQLPLHRGWVRAVAFSPDGRRLAAGSSEGSVSLLRRDR